MKTKITQTTLSSSLLEIMRNVQKAFQGKFAKILSQQCFSRVQYPHGTFSTNEVCEPFPPWWLNDWFCWPAASMC